MKIGLWVVGCGLWAVASAQTVSSLVLDARTGGVITRDWEDVDRPVPIGSLVKPFTALAFAERHSFDFPRYACKEHGNIGIREAIAWSCNDYFLALETRPEDAVSLAGRFGIAGPGRGAPPRALAGLGDGWEVSPLALARAYCELAARSGPGVDEVLAGMALSAAIGTARAVGGTALAKTGTAPCIHEHRMPGDGYTIVLYPKEAPRIALLVRVHGVPGSHAAATAGEMLRACQYYR